MASTRKRCIDSDDASPAARQDVTQDGGARTEEPTTTVENRDDDTARGGAQQGFARQKRSEEMEDRDAAERGEGAIGDAHSPRGERGGERSNYS